MKLMDLFQQFTSPGVPTDVLSPRHTISLILVSLNVLLWCKNMMVHHRVLCWL